MSKAEEATNGFCTRCFKYSKCSEVQSECTMADSYQEGYEDGYHQAEKDLALTWEDINRIEIIIKDVYRDYPYGIEAKQFGIEVLNRFNKQKEDGKI